MGKQFIVWREDSEREDGKRIEANYEREAVHKWAEWYDAYYAEYLIVGGQEARVFVALDEDGAETLHFEVRGEPQPVYCARLL